MEYQQWLVEIRPEIIISNSDNSITEEFQNETVRPILKLLNTTIIEFSKSFIAALDINFKNKTNAEFEQILINLVKKHPTFKTYLLGMVISYFTKDELSTYLKNQKQHNKRIYILLQERLRSQLLFLGNL